MCKLWWLDKTGAGTLKLSRRIAKRPGKLYLFCLSPQTLLLWSLARNEYDSNPPDVFLFNLMYVNPRTLKGVWSFGPPIGFANLKIEDFTQSN